MPMNPREIENSKHTDKASREREQKGPLNKHEKKTPKKLDYTCLMDRLTRVREKGHTLRNGHKAQNYRSAPFQTM